MKCQQLRQHIQNRINTHAVITDRFFPVFYNFKKMDVGDPEMVLKRESQPVLTMSVNE